MRKRKRGRPELKGSTKYLVRLQDKHIRRAKELGKGKVAAGIRAALEIKQPPAAGSPALSPKRS